MSSQNQTQALGPTIQTAEHFLNLINDRAFETAPYRVTQTVAYLKRNLKDRWPNFNEVFRYQLCYDLQQLCSFLHRDGHGSAKELVDILRGNSEKYSPASTESPEPPKDLPALGKFLAVLARSGPAPWAGTAHALGHEARRRLSRRQRALYDV
ncbi:uncharacterized protein JCM6883_000024 [Sporobolomyces salmoneus]|uniref:uncharacterized protein n=1 Tax=Sporobolomyces salmoneus TaxID=183962 RepID=UPI00317C5E37